MTKDLLMPGVREHTCPACGGTIKVTVTKEMLQLLGQQTVRNLIAALRCNACAANRVAIDKDALWRRKQEEKTRRWEDVCPPIYRDTTPSRVAKGRMAAVLGFKFGPRGVLIHGPPDTQKTRCAFLILARLWEEGRSVRALNAVDFGIEGPSRMARGLDRFEEWAGALERVDALLFDDLGKGKMTDRAEEILYRIIEHRTANRLPLIVTTNDTPETLMQRLSPDRGPAIVRRLMEFCEAVCFQ